MASPCFAQFSIYLNQFAPNESVMDLLNLLSRLRQRYREALRMEVASTVSDPSDVDQELPYLYQILTT
jgi:hypothetical protein